MTSGDGYDPKFKHDCDTCEWLGTLTGPDPYQSNSYRTWDLYHCPRAELASIVARYGSDGPNYQSMPISLIKRCLLGSHASHPVYLWALSLLEMSK